MNIITFNSDPKPLQRSQLKIDGSCYDELAMASMATAGLIVDDHYDSFLGQVFDSPLDNSFIKESGSGWQSLRTSRRFAHRFHSDSIVGQVRSDSGWQVGWSDSVWQVRSDSGWQVGVTMRDSDR